MPQDVGIEGIVLLEGKDVFYMITCQNCVKKVVKNGRVFEVMRPAVENLVRRLSGVSGCAKSEK